MSQSPVSAFLALLAECGCTLCRDGVILPARDVPRFQHKLEQRLKADPSLLRTFISGLQTFISDSSSLRRLFASPIDNMQDTVAHAGADSLARLFLSTPTIQTDVAIMFLEKLPEHFGNTDTFSNGTLPSVRESIPRLILSQFKWLDYLVDGENVTRKLMEVLSICPMGLKKEIITLIPEIVSDDNHQPVVTTLEQMLHEEFQLVAPVLDAFSNLNLDESLLDQVVSLAITSLRSADAEDLPLVVRFLLQSANVSNARRIVHQFRENLQFSVVGVKEGKHDRKLKGKAVKTDHESLVLEAIKSGLRFQNVMCEAFLKEIKGLDQVQEHKVIDFLLLLVIYANGGPHRKTAGSILKKKAVQGLLSKHLLNQSIRGRVELLQDYFQPLLSTTHNLLACKESSARQLGSHAYVLLFEEFTDTYHRQEVLGSLVTHTGSGIDYEVGSALDALVLISSTYAQYLLPLSSFINGILDYLEGFQDNHLHQVYKVFGQLSLAAWTLGPIANGGSMANELSIVLRKQITNPDSKFKKMGIIGVVGLISCIGSKVSPQVCSLNGNTQKASIEETFSLLQLIMEVCKTSSLARGFFYDELALLCETVSLETALMEWVSKQTVDFESLFLVDLDAGNIPIELRENGVLEGCVWMNLDGDVSPILLNIQSLLSPDDPRSCQLLVFLPSSFRLLAAIEKATNQGSLGNIDALLGCPFYLPKHKILAGDQWKGLTRSLKETACLSLFYGINWIRELLNAYSTQIEGLHDNLTQATREEISVKLLKRMRNLIFLERLLNECMKCTPLSLPLLHCDSEEEKPAHRQLLSSKKASGTIKRGRKRKALSREETQNAANSQTDNNDSQVSGSKQKQTKLPECFGRKSGEGTQLYNNSQIGNGEMHPDTSGVHDKECKSTDDTDSTIEVAVFKEINEKIGPLGEQRWKFRPLNIHSLSILTISQDKPEVTCCPDPCAELLLHVYLLRDIFNKLECFDSHPRKQFPWTTTADSPKAPSGLGTMTAAAFLKSLEQIFVSLRKHLDTAAKILCLCSTAMDSSCDCHWEVESLAAGCPDSPLLMPSRDVVAGSTFLLIVRCLSKIFANSELITEKCVSTLMNLLSALSTKDSTEKFLLDLKPPPSPDSLEYAFCSTYTYLDELFDAATSISFSVATELVLVQKRLLTCAEACIDLSKTATSARSSLICTTGFLSYLKSRLSVSAGRVLRHEWDDEGKCLKNKGDALQQLLHMFIQYNDAPMDLLKELSSNIMPQVPVQKPRSGGCVGGYPTLSLATFLVWYRVQHEQLSNIFLKVMKNVLALHKSRTVDEDDVSVVLIKVRECATIMVALTNLTKIHHNKTPLHSLAVKFGGKFIDTFLKGIDFFQAQYQVHKDAINALVKELQKATRTVQTLCSEAKGLKKMPITSKIPAVKRSLERYVFCVKALLHSASDGNSFWMGNLKHKNLQGQEVGSQLPVSDEEREETLSVDDEEEEGEAVGLAEEGSEGEMTGNDEI